MGVRLEIILSLAIVGIISGSLTVKLNNTAKGNEVFTKELEFTNTTFTEVDTIKMQGTAYSTYGIRDNGVLTLDNFVYSTETIRSLVADKARYEGDVIYLDGNVMMAERDGHTYDTEHANYNQKTEIINITAPFVGLRGKNIYKGTTLWYNTRSKEAFAAMINAVVYTTEK